MEDYLGMIKIFAGSYAPKGWLFCQGQVLQIASYRALASILGTQFGGDGATTFALPDLCGRLPVGAGNGPGLAPVAYGAAGGSMNASLTADNVPAHTHGVTGSVQLMAADAPGNSKTPAGAYLTQPGFAAYSADPGTEIAGDLEINLKAAISGNNNGLNIMPPYIGANFIICATMGVYPPPPQP